MKRELMFGTVLATAFVAGIAAQQPSAPPPSAPPSAQEPTAQQPRRERPPSTDSASRTVTVTGCLTSAGSGGAQPGAEPGAAPTSGSPAQFMLTSASIAGSSSAGTSGATPGASPSAAGTTGAKPGSSAGALSTYRLSGGGDSLKQYANSRVEVTGTLQGASPMGDAAGPGSPSGAGTPGPGAGTAPRPGSSPGAAGPSTTSERTGAEAAVQTLRVTSVKQISASCSGEGR